MDFTIILPWRENHLKSIIQAMANPGVIGTVTIPTSFFVTHTALKTSILSLVPVRYIQRETLQLLSYRTNLSLKCSISMIRFCLVFVLVFFFLY